ncbi:predicted protein [Histoplasma capsulatum H143]|uniref:Uncharacterized protein n=1 Tax=Ajellomyces capsulatus (strain H143) TaxID=544712 RepID=C6H693_AJECH|nr:predicted protein [Histoplasma capsulatum H143]
MPNNNGSDGELREPPGSQNSFNIDSIPDPNRLEHRSAGVSDLESPTSRLTIDGRAENEIKMPECQRTSFHSYQPVMTSSKHFVSRCLEHRCLRDGISIFGIHRAPPLRSAYMMLISFTMKDKRLQLHV